MESRTERETNLVGMAAKSILTQLILILLKVKDPMDGLTPSKETQERTVSKDILNHILNHILNRILNLRAEKLTLLPLRQESIILLLLLLRLESTILLLLLLPLKQQESTILLPLLPRCLSNHHLLIAHQSNQVSLQLLHHKTKLITLKPPPLPQFQPQPLFNLPLITQPQLRIHQPLPALHQHQHLLPLQPQLPTQLKLRLRILLPHITPLQQPQLRTHQPLLALHQHLHLLHQLLLLNLHIIRPQHNLLTIKEGTIIIIVND